MKKFISLMIVAIMAIAMVAAVAENADWSEVQMPDVGMHFYRPADMEVGEAEGCEYYAENGDLVLAIYCIADGESTLADQSASLTEQGYTVAENALAEAGLTYDHLVVGIEDDDSYFAVIFQGVDGYFYDFECQALSDNGAYVFGQMIGSLQPMA